jgi:hypothetical protein
MDEQKLNSSFNNNDEMTIYDENGKWVYQLDGLFSRQLANGTSEHKTIEIVHELKTWPEYFQEVDNGNKTFELRKNDRDYKVGNILILREWCPKKGEYTGRTINRGIKYVLKDDEQSGLKEWYVILGLGNHWVF